MHSHSRTNDDRRSSFCCLTGPTILAGVSSVSNLWSNNQNMHNNVTRLLKMVPSSRFWSLQLVLFDRAEIVCSGARAACFGLLGIRIRLNVIESLPQQSSFLQTMCGSHRFLLFRSEELMGDSHVTEDGNPLPKQKQST